MNRTRQLTYTTYMDTERSHPATTTIGISLLPYELLHEIFCRLALPELLRLTSVSKSLSSLISCQDFRRLYTLRSGSGGRWVFVYRKRPPRDSMLHGFNDLSGRWFKIPIASILSPAVPPGEDLYFLAAAGDFFLFASNGMRELLAVDLRTRTVRKIPASPLGPRGTSSWRRSGLKLVSGPDRFRFRFMFAELHGDRPVLFEYCSVANAWHALEAALASLNVEAVEVKDRVCLTVSHMGSESLLLSASSGAGGGGRSSSIVEAPVVYRPRLPGGHASDRMYVYGDGGLAVVRSGAVGEGGGRVRVVTGVELWGTSRDGREWEMVAVAPWEVMERVRKPYGVMMGCLEESGGVMRLVLMSSLNGSWDIVWVSYDRVGKGWVWVPVPECGTEGLNMAGIALSSSFAGLRPESAW